MRKVIIGLVATFGLLAGVISGSVPAFAFAVFLDGGSGCTGQGFSWIYANGTAEAGTEGCASSNRYLQAVIWFNNGGNAFYDGTWASQNQSFARSASYSPYEVDGVHNLCYAWCSGYYSTYDY